MCELCESVRERLHSEAESGATVEELTAAEVEIARINADRDITLARIGAGVEKSVVAAETDAQLVAAETEAATLSGVVESLTPDPEPALPAPVIVAPAEPEADPTEMPPAEEHHEEKEKPRPRGFF